LGHGLGGRAHVSHRVRGIDFDQLFEDIVRELPSGVIDLRLRSRGRKYKKKKRGEEGYTFARVQTVVSQGFQGSLISFAKIVHTSSQNKVQIMHSRRLLIFAILIFASLVSDGQSTPSGRPVIPQEPTNLGKLKTRLIAYHNCTGNTGCYTSDLDRQSHLAIAILRRRAARVEAGEKLALVLDIDETALSNWDEETRDDFGYIAKDWNDWVDKRQATAIAGTLRLYKEAVTHGVSIFFISGRGESQREATTDNLKSAGYDGWNRLALRGPHPKEQSTTEFKSSERKKMVDAGYHIILNVGDQLSDLNGSPQAEHSVKLPNPFYYIP
jgi:acid phosphatase